MFEYDAKGRKYAKDMKMGRRWRMMGLGKKVRKPKEESGKQEWKVEKKKGRRFCPGLVGNLKISEKHGLPD